MDFPLNSFEFGSENKYLMIQTFKLQSQAPQPQNEILNVWQRGTIMV